MSSQKIQRLLEPPNVSAAHRSALEYFNSNFAHIDNLNGIDQVLSQTKTRSSELQRQLSASQQSIDSLITKTRVAALANLDTARGFAEDRESIENEMTYLSYELVSSLSPSKSDANPTLLEDIETMHRILKDLESVRAYVAVIERTLTLSEGALAQLRATSSPLSKSSTSEYSRLSAFVSDVGQACESVQDIGSAEQSLHLVTFVRRIRDKTWLDIKEIFSTKLNGVLENLQWPMAVDYPAASVHDRKSFESAFKDLILLQEIGDNIEGSTNQGSQGLYPLETLAHAISLRFKYHFETERETNRLDKPEWYLSHIMNVALDHRPFMDNVIQRLLLGTKYQYVNAWQNYITLLVPILERKLRRTVPTLLSHPALLAHTVYQALIFDSSMRGLGYEFVVGTEAKKTEEKGGVSSVILCQKEWFDAWLEGEKKFAEDQYHEIISSPDAWVIVDDDSNESDEHKLSRSMAELKATNSARRIKALVEQVTDRCSPLPSSAHRARFLIHIQLPILEQYYSRVSSSLDAFETLSSALVRAVPGALGVEGPKTDSRKLTGGVEGSQRLCKALLSARYVESAMQRWGEEEFFLELWTEINNRAALRSQAEMHPSLPNYADHQASKSDVPNCTIFEELITQYTKLASRAEDILVSQVCGETESALKPHFVAITSPKDGSDAQNADDGIAVPPSLLPSIALLSAHLTFLRNTLPTAVTTQVYRRIATLISEHILQREVLFRPGLTRGQFRTGLSREQARSVHAESELWAETCQVALRTSRARAEGPWARLLVAGRLLGARRQEVDRAVKEVLGGQGDGWEDALDVATSLGSGGLGKEEVKTVLRLRDDL
ncbi:RINT-1 family protein [Suillus fuscotomentosus]|uniref:RINT-1 family protein n=1 Tax=Suillus fuscotomentosus TaxID=1912939 RepID=A0AAD4EEJ6_9AGAM|nr:RINT-1 family protein [Suillus fuscotomentosus]KAG1904794.1 RINT-1 family protein [Suillus fuscotomentosus]